jgi:hypothetical protein
MTQFKVLPTGTEENHRPVRTANFQADLNQVTHIRSRNVNDATFGKWESDVQIKTLLLGKVLL